MLERLQSTLFLLYLAFDTTGTNGKIRIQDSFNFIDSSNS
jgi:hypothetical protein